MAEFTSLTNPPITEAVIDIRVKVQKDFDVDIFKSLKEEKLKLFPNKEQQNQFQFDIQAEGEIPFKPKSKETRGYIYKSADNLNIVQFRKDGFTYNRLKPYTGWEEMIYTASELWDIYIKYSKPMMITRIATRFINQIKLPVSVNSGILTELMTSPPKNPINSDVISDYLYRIKLNDYEYGITTNLVQAFKGGTEMPPITLILDIDAYMENQLKPDDQNIWNNFSKLRAKKNDIFFKSLTDKALSPYL